MIISQGISLLLEEKLFTDKDTAHYLSYPVIRKEKEKYYMAVFYVFLTMKEAESGKVGRPLNWAILDIESGNVVEKRKTGNNEFCDAPKNKKYNVISEHACPNPVEYYNTAFDILDAVRVKIIENNEFNSVLYQKYLEMILEYTSMSPGKILWIICRGIHGAALRRFQKTFFSEQWIWFIRGLSKRSTFSKTKNWLRLFLISSHVHAISSKKKSQKYQRHAR